MAAPLNLDDEVEVDGIAGLVALLEHMWELGARPEMRPDDWMETVEYLEELHESYFNYELDPLGNSWPSLSPVTIQKKGHSRILIEVDRLFDSLTDSYHPEAIREYNPTELLFGTRREWAWVHQEGTPKIPQRQHTGVSEEGADEIGELMANAIVMMMFTTTV